MLGVLGVVQDLVDVIRVCAFHKNNVGPPLPEMGGDLDHLVFRLRIGFGIMIPLLDFPDKEALVPVGLAVDRGAEEAVGLLQNQRKDLRDVLLPEAAIEVDRILVPGGAGEGGVVLAAIGCVDVGDAVPELLRVRPGPRGGIEPGFAGSDMQKLIVGGKERWRHSRTSTTLDTYTHLFEKVQQHTADVMSATIERAKKEAQ